MAKNKFKSAQYQLLGGALFLAVFTVAVMFLFDPSGPLKKSKFEWEDACRVQAVFKIADELESFKKIKGHYPLQNHELFIVHPYGPLGGQVEILINDRREEIKPSPYNIMGFSYWPALYQELATVKTNLSLFSDPSEDSRFNPAIIRYVVDRDNYILSTYLFHKTSHTKMHGEHSHELSLSSAKIFPHSLVLSEVNTDEVRNILLKEIGYTKSDQECPAYKEADFQTARHNRNLRYVTSDFLLPDGTMVRVIPKRLPDKSFQFLQEDVSK